MSESMTPWLILAVAAAAILYLKGYIRLPSTAALSTKPASDSTTEKPKATSLDDVPADLLGMAWARSQKREAEEGVLAEIVGNAGKTIKESFSAPFSVAAPPVSESPK